MAHFSVIQRDSEILTKNLERKPPVFPSKCRAATAKTAGSMPAVVRAFAWSSPRVSPLKAPLKFFFVPASAENRLSMHFYAWFGLLYCMNMQFPFLLSPCLAIFFRPGCQQNRHLADILFGPMTGIICLFVLFIVISGMSGREASSGHSFPVSPDSFFG